MLFGGWRLGRVFECVDEFGRDIEKAKVEALGMEARHATTAKGAHLAAHMELNTQDIVIIKRCVQLERNLRRILSLINS
jgi:hypothetical protein